MKIIVGLGNPGGEYKDTRHNIGFMIVEKLAQELEISKTPWKEEEKFKSAIVKIGDVLLVKPVIFMNNSGIAVSAVAKFYKCTPSDIWVVHDDIDLPLGKIRIRSGGGSAGHNGVDSIIKELGSDQFIRFRMGIGRGKLFSKGKEEEERGEKRERALDKRLYHQSVVSFVLSHFSQGEAGELKHLIKHGTEAVQIALVKGIEKAMNRFN